MDNVNAPPAVELTARERGLGALLRVRASANPVKSAGGYLIAAVVAAVAFVLLGKLAELFDGLRGLQKAIALLALTPLVFGCGFVIAAIVVLIRGSRGWYLWEGGFAFKHNSKVWAYPWAEVSELQLKRYENGENAGKIYQYRVVPSDGRPIAVPVELTDDRDPFNEALAEAVRAAGRPVS